MAKFRKKPVVVEAIQWNGGKYECLDQFCGRNWGRADSKGIAWSLSDDKEQVVVWDATKDQWLYVRVGSWIIRGVAGELYPCDPDIFAATYEPVTEAGAEEGKC